MDAKMNPPSMTSDMEDFPEMRFQIAAVITDSGWSLKRLSFPRYDLVPTHVTGASTLPAEDKNGTTKYLEPD